MFIEINKSNDLPVAKGSSESKIHDKDVFVAVDAHAEGQWKAIEFPTIWFDEMQKDWRFSVTVKRC